jgi:hypothetical protein
VDAPVLDWQMSTVPYKVARLTRAGLITDGAKMAAMEYDLVPLQDTMARPVQAVTGLINQQLIKVLKSASLNETQAAGTAWNASNPSPLKNMKDAIRKVGGKAAEMIGIFGRQQMDDLQFSSDFTGRIALNPGTTGVSDGFMAQVIAEVTGLRLIVVGDSLYNMANPGQALSLGYQFDGVAWIGYPGDLVFVQQGAFNAEWTRDVSKESDFCVYSRRTAIVRGHKEMGVAITGVRS